MSRDSCASCWRRNISPSSSWSSSWRKKCSPSTLARFSAASGRGARFWGDHPRGLNSSSHGRHLRTRAIGCFLRAVGFGEEDLERVPLLPAARAFVQIHLDMTLRSWLEALGAVSPGHEWAIPLMFPCLMQGIERSLRLPSAALEYFRLHINLDVEHGKVLQESLLRWATTEENQDNIRRGARRSLEARAAFWSALGEQLFPNLSSVAAGWTSLGSPLLASNHPSSSR